MASLISSIGGEGGMIKLEHFKQWMHSLAVRAPVPAPFFLLGPPAGLTPRTQLAACPYYLGPIDQPPGEGRRGAALLNAREPGSDSEL